MEGLTDPPMRALQTRIGAFTFCVTEFLRISNSVPGRRAFERHAPELLTGAKTAAGTPVQIQLLGGDASIMADAASSACDAGAQGIDINFGCPAPTVNNNDGGAALLRHPRRIRDIVSAVRSATPRSIPVSAKLRLGWDCDQDIFVNAEMAAEGGASWIVIHGRTRVQGYEPPAHWEPIGRVNAKLGIPIVANGDIWSIDDFRACRNVTGCRHFMLGRGALVDPFLSHRIARELGLGPSRPAPQSDWRSLLRLLQQYSDAHYGRNDRATLARMKQWLAMANRHGTFRRFDCVKRVQSIDDLMALLASVDQCEEADGRNSAANEHRNTPIDGSVCSL